MRVHLCAVGRLRAGPERDLIDDYITRFNRTGRALGLGPFAECEVEDRKGGGMEAEATLLARAVPSGAVSVVLDERGRTLSSPGFADQLAKWRDVGRQDVAFCIGGADGLAAYAGAGDAGRTVVSCGVDFGGQPLPQGVALGPIAAGIFAKMKS